MPKLSTRAAWSGLALVALLAVGSTEGWGQELPPAPAAYLNDHAGLVSTGEAARLEEKLRELDQETSTQVVVAVFPRLPSPSLEDFTARTAEAWRVGRDELDNGAVLFVFVADKKMRIEVGYGLEGALPDALAGRILAEQVSPRFQQGDWAGGLEAGIDGIVAAVRGEYAAPPRPARRPGRSLSTIVIVLILIVLFLLMSRMGPPGHPGRTYGRGGRRRDSTHWGGGHWGGGGGFGGGGSFGGGGGFMGGGGSFGGGGASGSW